jgi:hypothetical protein
MSSKKSSSRLLGESAWVYSLLTGVLSFIFIFIVGSIVPLFGASLDMAELIGFGITGVVVVAICFFICKRFPKSLWYTILLCNLYGIFAATILTFEANWDEPLWILIIGVWGLSIISAILGRAKSKT